MVTASVSFRVMGKHLEPSEISHLLGIEPSQAHKSGDPNIGRSGRLYSVFSEGLWMIELPRVEFDLLNEQLKNITSQLLQKRTLLQEIRARKCRIDILIGMFGIEGNAGISINSEIISRLAAIGVDLEFDFYCC